MPTYQYRCTECGEDLEVVQSFSDDPLTVCPSCQGALRKVFTPVGVVFKGSGFYKTDSRSKPATSTGPAKDGGAKDAGSGSTDAGSGTSSGTSTGSSGAASDSGSSGSSGSSATKTDSAAPSAPSTSGGAKVA